MQYIFTCYEKQLGPFVVSISIARRPRKDGSEVQVLKFPAARFRFEYTKAEKPPNLVLL